MVPGLKDMKGSISQKEYPNVTTTTLMCNQFLQTTIFPVASNEVQWFIMSMVYLKLVQSLDIAWHGLHGELKMIAPS